MLENRAFIFRLVSVAAVIMVSLATLCAQPKSIGANFSVTGLAACYEHYQGKGDSFVELTLKAEMSEMVPGRTDVPGVSCSFTWNIELMEWLSVNGNRLTLFAGPGVIAGLGHDFKGPYGFFGGLKGRVGVECAFERKITISAFVSPVIGSHFELNGEGLLMKLYKNGVIYGLMPEISIKYRF